MTENNSRGGKEDKYAIDLFGYFFEIFILKYIFLIK